MQHYYTLRPPPPRLRQLSKLLFFPTEGGGTQPLSEIHAPTETSRWPLSKRTIGIVIAGAPMVPEKTDSENWYQGGGVVRYLVCYAYHIIRLFDTYTGRHVGSVFPLCLFVTFRLSGYKCPREHLSRTAFRTNLGHRRLPYNRYITRKQHPLRRIAEPTVSKKAEGEGSTTKTVAFGRHLSRGFSRTDASRSVCAHCCPRFAEKLSLQLCAGKTLSRSHPTAVGVAVVNVKVNSTGEPLQCQPSILRWKDLVEESSHGGRG